MDEHQAIENHRMKEKYQINKENSDPEENYIIQGTEDNVCKF